MLARDVGCWAHHAPCQGLVVPRQRVAVPAGTAGAIVHCHAKLVGTAAGLVVRRVKKSVVKCVVRYVLRDGAALGDRTAVAVAVLAAPPVMAADDLKEVLVEALLPAGTAGSAGKAAAGASAAERSSAPPE